MKTKFRRKLLARVDRLVAMGDALEGLDPSTRDPLDRLILFAGRWQMDEATTMAEAIRGYAVHMVTRLLGEEVGLLLPEDIKEPKKGRK